MEPSDAVLERRRVREVTGIVHSRAGLDAAANELLLAGFDRGDIDVLGSLTEIPKRLGPVYVTAEELADIKYAPRRPLVARDDVTVTSVVVASLVGAVCGVAVAYWWLPSGGGEVSP